MFNKKFIAIFISVFLTLSLGVSVYLLKYTTFFKQKAAEPILTTNLSIQTADQIASDIKKLTSSIISYSVESSSKLPLNLEDISKQRVSDSVTRKEKMLALLEKDVAKFFEYAVPEKVIASYDPKIKNNFEKEIEISGEIENIIAENFEKKESKVELYLKANNKRYQLFVLDKNMETIPNGSITKIGGFIINNKIAVSTYSTPINKQTDDGLITLVNPDEQQFNIVAPSPTPSATPRPTINKKIAVVLFNFENRKEEPWTAENIKKWTFTERNSVAGYYKEISFGKLNFTGDVFGWITVPIIVQDGLCPAYEGSIKAKEILISQGVNIDSYDYITYAFPGMSCWAAGWAQLKGKESWINGSYLTYSNPPSGTNLNTNVGVVIHEIGHNLGTHHANFLDCIDSNNNKVSIGQLNKCTSYEYGDPFDVMGSNLADSRHFNAYHKAQVGLLELFNKAQVTKQGKYNIFPMERNLPTRVQSLRIPAGYELNGGRLFYYLEYRRPLGRFDNFQETDDVVNGVSIRLGGRYIDYYKQTNLIDSTANAIYNITDSALGLNQTFDDNIRGIKIKTTFVGPNYATIEYSKYTPPCVRSKPDVKLYPISSWGKPGESLQYGIELINNDSPSCGPSEFKINPVLFSDWKQYPENLSITAKPLEKAIQTIYVSSSLYNPYGYFTFKEGIRHSAGSQYSVSLLANYNVYYSDVTPPEITFINPTDGQTAGSGYQKITLSITDKDTAVAWAGVRILNFNENVCERWTECWFDFSKLPNGMHTLVVSAGDVVNNYTEKSINVIVSKDLQSPTPTSTSISIPTDTPSPTSSSTSSPQPPTPTP